MAVRQRHKGVTRPPCRRQLCDSRYPPDDRHGHHQRIVCPSGGRWPLPADARRRWDLLEGGSVEIADLGDSLLILPAGHGGLRALVGDAGRRSRRLRRAWSRCGRFRRARSRVSQPGGRGRRPHPPEIAPRRRTGRAPTVGRSGGHDRALVPPACRALSSSVVTGSLSPVARSSGCRHRGGGSPGGHSTAGDDRPGVATRALLADGRRAGRRRSGST